MLLEPGGTSKPANGRAFPKLKLDLKQLILSVTERYLPDSEVPFFVMVFQWTIYLMDIQSKQPSLCLGGILPNNYLH